jgi:hypothetical protein
MNKEEAKVMQFDDEPYGYTHMECHPCNICGKTTKEGFGYAMDWVWYFCGDDECAVKLRERIIIYINRTKRIPLNWFLAKNIPLQFYRPRNKTVMECGVRNVGPHLCGIINYVTEGSFGIHVQFKDKNPNYLEDGLEYFVLTKTIQLENIFKYNPSFCDEMLKCDDLFGGQKKIKIGFSDLSEECNDFFARLGENSVNMADELFK